MSAITSTYRLQLRGDMDFAKAASLAHYFARLGISHLYLSPIFKSVAGSTHGYDAVDMNEVEPAIGGRPGFEAMAQALHAEGIGIILDIVPNHMGASPANPWWRDVLEWGQASRFAQHFDVDWSAPNLAVPALGKPYGQTLGSGELKLNFVPECGSFELAYHDLELPLTPPSYATILTEVEGEPFAELARRFAAATPDSAPELKDELAEAARDQAVSRSIGNAVVRLISNSDRLHETHEAQVWRLVHWRASRESLTYRRFFEISDLVGIKVEQGRVFDDAHSLILELVAAGLVDGLRIDHVDGLADPAGYLKRLRAAIGNDDVYIVVEKILGHGEDVKPAWPVAGTTGYEVVTELARLFVSPSAEPVLTAAYDAFVGRQVDFEADVLAAKRRTLMRNLAGELTFLTAQVLAIAQGDIDTRDFGSDTLRRAIVELATALPVYRTYIDAAGADAADARLLETAATAAKSTREVEDEHAIDFLVRVLELDVGSPERQAAALAFAVRFQQTTGPLMAKALEDTMFYRYNRLIALNEVGGEPARFGGSISEFHDAMQRRRATNPAALSATATHDTKRGEDARTRIYAISEAPDIWCAAVERWTALLAANRTGLDHGATPEPEMEWMFYQSLLGVWPADLAADDARGISILADRMVAFFRKAAREAKLRTSWSQPDNAYEAGLERFVRGVLARPEFVTDFLGVAHPFIQAGAANSLTQLAIKLFAPGVPDIYQGTEFWDLALVDPDNRAPVDYQARSVALNGNVLGDWTTGAIKLRFLQAGLALRRELGPRFAESRYIPLTVEGPQRNRVAAFARSIDAAVVVVIGLRSAFGALSENPALTPDRRIWEGTAVRWNDDLDIPKLTDIVFGREIAATGKIEVAELLADAPVAMLRETS